jgi:hypothetical protein
MRLFNIAHFCAVAGRRANLMSLKIAPWLAFTLAAGTTAGRVSHKILNPRSVAVAGAHLKLLNSAAAVFREAKSDGPGLSPEITPLQHRRLWRLGLASARLSLTEG